MVNLVFEAFKMFWIDHLRLVLILVRSCCSPWIWSLSACEVLLRNDERFSIRWVLLVTRSTLAVSNRILSSNSSCIFFKQVYGSTVVNNNDPYTCCCLILFPLPPPDLFLLRASPPPSLALTGFLQTLLCCSDIVVRFGKGTLG